MKYVMLQPRLLIGCGLMFVCQGIWFWAASVMHDDPEFANFLWYGVSIPIAIVANVLVWKVSRQAIREREARRERSSHIRFLAEKLVDTACAHHVQMMYVHRRIALLAEKRGYDPLAVNGRGILYCFEFLLRIADDYQGEYEFLLDEIETLGRIRASSK